MGENQEIIDAANVASQINEVFNHKRRRWEVRTALRNQKFVVTDNVGNQKVTNRLKQTNREESHNVKNWLDRVKKSQEIGSKIQRIHEEQNYNQVLNAQAERDAKYLQFLIESYGETEGQAKYDAQQLREEKKREKKARVKK